jgi:protein gp37
MAQDSKIEWTDHTFNPWIGCTPVSCACDHCYAADLSNRYGWAKFEAGAPRHRTSAETWKQPLRWNRRAQANGVRERVFCASLADVFDTEVPDAWRADLFELLVRTPRLDWLLLTKRPQVAAKYFAGAAPRPNIWLGTTVENQAMADLRIPALLSINVKIRFLSCEPLLGPIDLGAVRQTVVPGFFGDALGWHHRGKCHEDEGVAYPSIAWVIAGGESGRNARPSQPDWFRALRDQCAGAAVPFFFKQWGEYAPTVLDQKPGEAEPWRIYPDGRRMWGFDELLKDSKDWPRELMNRVGKKAAGAMLDGREHREFPR